LQSNREHLNLALDKAMATGKRKFGLIGLSFKSGTDDLRESPLVTLAEQLIGKGMQLAIYDPAVRLSQLLGANRRYIDAHMPHIGKLLRAELGDVIRESEVLVVGQSGPEILTALKQFCEAGQIVLDLVKLGDRNGIRAKVQGLCW
jgi:GDP-mannose 6-dehydrogenase